MSMQVCQKYLFLYIIFLFISPCSFSKCICTFDPWLEKMRTAIFFWGEVKIQQIICVSFIASLCIFLSKCNAVVHFLCPVHRQSRHSWNHHWFVYLSILSFVNATRMGTFTTLSRTSRETIMYICRLQSIHIRILIKNVHSGCIQTYRFARNGDFSCTHKANNVSESEDEKIVFSCFDTDSIWRIHNSIIFPLMRMCARSHSQIFSIFMRSVGISFTLLYNTIDFFFAWVLMIRHAAVIMTVTSK